MKVLRKSIDARKSKIIFNYKVAVYIREMLPKTSDYQFEYQDVSLQGKFIKKNNAL